MTSPARLFPLAFLALTLLGPGPGLSCFAQRQMEALGRGVVAMPAGAAEVFVAWRMLGTDPDDLGFNLYRATGGAAPVRLNAAPLTGGTNHLDTGVNLSVENRYFVRPVLLLPGGAAREFAPSASFTLPPNPPLLPYLSVPLQVPAGGTTPDAVAYTYSPNDASVGDLDGDGEYEIVVKWDPSNSRDNSQSGFTGNVFLDAYRLDGTRLWRIDLGRNIRAGAHYTQFMVYDLDGDGRAEIACKTAPGTVDGTGAFIGDPVRFAGTPPALDHGADYRNASGYVLAGPELLTIFDGLTGAERATTNYVPPRHPDTLTPTSGQLNALWGDGYGNRVDRFLACVATLDGARPSLVMCRGYYTRTVLAAWDWRDGNLTQRWTFDSDDGTPGALAYRGQGNHQLSVADVDADGRDEIIYGACAIDDDGTGLYTTGLGHGDALHVSDLNPARPGLEVFQPHESPSAYGPNAIEFRDARTGALLWGVEATGDIGRGVALDIDPRHPGYEMWASGGTGGLYTAGGWTADPALGPRAVPVSASKPSQINFGVWWDGDLLREILDQNFINKWDWDAGAATRLLTAAGAASNNGTKATPALCADILGDWREEVVLRSADNQELRIYTTVIPTDHRLYTLMHDPQYRLAAAWQNVAYNQPAHPGFFLGAGMARPPTPDIATGGPAGSARLANLSVRSPAGAGDETLIVGVVVEGAGSGNLLLRAIGPGLLPFGVADALVDPRLQLFASGGGAAIEENDDWGGSPAMAAAFANVGAFPLPADSRDAAILPSLAAGAYTAHVGAAGGASGIALGEVYAVDPGAGPRLVNVSTRAAVGTGDKILIAGFVVAGEDPMTVLVRAVGPGLEPFGVGGVLADPRLEVFQGSRRIAGNEDWAHVSGASTATFARAGAFGLPVESADAVLLLRLSPGAYTAQASGVAEGTGVGLIEVYEVRP